MNFYIMTIEYYGCELFGVYRNSDDELVKVFKSIEEVREYKRKLG